MATLSQAALWLIDQGTREAFGPEPRYWMYGNHFIPRDEYHQIVILVVGDYSIDARKVIAKNFEEQAKNAGFRLLKVKPMGDQVLFVDEPAYLFSGYVASDVIPKTGNELSSALFGAPLVWDSQEVNLAEAASLDALWIAAGELEAEIQDIQVAHGLQINYWPLVGGAILVFSGGLMLYTILSKVFKEARA